MTTMGDGLPQIKLLPTNLNLYGNQEENQGFCTKVATLGPHPTFL